MPVFLSHKREDTTETLLVAHYMQSKGVICYVDVLDPSVKTTEDLTKLLMERVQQCSHLMAVVSSYTVQSWWVPFEIGVGSELKRRITTYRISGVQLPDYLSKWPVLSSYDDLDRFIQWYRLDSTVSTRERASGSAGIHTADQFHMLLKAHLGQ